MAYIGKTPTIGNFQVCDAISVVDAQAAYTMQVATVDVSPESANHMIVSLNGVIQKPTDAYTVSGSTITFASNLVTGDVIDFIQILGNVLDLGVPSDDTVSTAKIVDGAVTSAKLTYPLTTFSSTGIDDNATANALTIDSSSNLQFNSGFGSVTTVYGCRSWVNFNGTGTVAIRASGNVSSITDNGTGYYTVNLTTAMPDINCAVLLSNGNGTPNAARDTIKTGTMVTTSSFYISLYSGGALDSDFINAAVFR
jgi:hypothetical protein